MRLSLRRTIIIVVIIELAIIGLVLSHPIFPAGLQGIFKFAPLTGALLGGGLTLISMFRNSRTGDYEPWYGNEQLAWVLIGCGQIMWALGEGFWRYFNAIGQTPFPSLADGGYALFPLLCFVGLLILPSVGTRLQRTLVALDSLTAMGALLAISWYLLLGALALAPIEGGLAKFLGLYYPTADACLLSCVVFLLMRGQNRLYQATARNVSLWILGLGFCFFTTSDFLFNIQNNAGTYTEGWMDLGWPLGMLMIGLAAYLRRFLPRTSSEIIEERVRNRAQSMRFGFIQIIPYLLISILFFVLILNIVSVDKTQMSIRLVLLLATIGVVVLVIVRQILTIRENEHLSALQARFIKKIEEQSRIITERNTELEEGIAHLKTIQTNLANGNTRARAHLKEGILWSLAISLNVLAERLESLAQDKRHLEQVRVALVDLSSSIERSRTGHGFKLPPSCNGLPEVIPIMHAIGLHKTPHTPTRVASTPPTNSPFK